MKPWRLIVAVMGGLMCASPGFSQEMPTASVRITRQELRTDRLVPLPDVEQLLLTRVGDPPDEGLIRRSIRRLLATDLFGAVDVQRLQVAGGIELIYQARTRPRVRAFRFTGNRTFLDRELRAAVSLRDGGDLREGGVPIAAEELLTFYRDRGYLDVGVTPAVETDSRSGDVTVTFAVREGILFTTRTIGFEGNREVAEGQLRPLLRSHPDAPYDGRTFQRDVRRLEEHYLSAGFYAITVRGAEQRVEPGSVDLIIQIREGPRTQVRWEGALAFPPESLERLLTFREERVVDEFEVESSLSAIETHYREHGFPLVTVRSSMATGAQGRIVTFSIDEGPRFLVGAVRIQGNASFPESRL